MLFANQDGVKARAQVGVTATCPDCSSEMIAKCGEIIIWHWAHRSAADCDSWSGGETEWHLKWKSLFHPSQVERSRLRRYYRGEWSEAAHRADVISRHGCVVEFQASPISPEDIRERNAFWGSVVWVFDTRDAFANERLKFRVRDRGSWFSFKWSHPRRTILTSRNPPWLTYFDCGESLFEARGIHEHSFLSGWGYWRSHEWFVNEHKAVDPAKIAAS